MLIYFGTFPKKKQQKHIVWHNEYVSAVYPHKLLMLIYFGTFPKKKQQKHIVWHDEYVPAVNSMFSPLPLLAVSNNDVDIRHCVEVKGWLLSDTNETLAHTDVSPLPVAAAL
jgi:hypothetical protein